jgi:threonine 3-dehydrogenase
LKAIAKVRPEPGADFVDVQEPTLKPGHIKMRVCYGSVCGTDLHIFAWDPWAASRILPPRIIGHEFSGIVEEVAEDVTELKPGDTVASESHIVCGHCKQCRNGQGHVCVNTKILGVDVDGGFAPVAVIPWQNARKTPPSVPLDVACVQDPLGNAVHTAMAGPVAGQDILITGMGPIGLFAVGVCKALGANSVVVTEVSPYRLQLAERMGADLIIDPSKEDPVQLLANRYPEGIDGTLEMSGHPSALSLAVVATRPGGRVSLLGLFPEKMMSVPLNDAIFKGLDIQCIVGRRIWETWDQMSDLLAGGKLDILPVLTHRYHYSEFNQAMEAMAQGKTGKVVFEIAPNAANCQ